MPFRALQNAPSAIGCSQNAGRRKIHFDTDYLIIGGGASGLAFADTIIAETDATVTIVDKDFGPGGHWNRAYPFVRLHQPSSHYGVMSRPLGQDRIETTGGNKGLAELSSLAEIRAYFQAVLDEVLLPSGRVTYLPNCEMREDGTAVSLISGEVHTFQVNHKLVAAHYGGGTIPATHTPPFDVDEGAHFIPVGGLADLRAPASQYVILGSGKTGIDACLWLLGNGVDADNIVWVMPRDSWFLDRRFAQPGAAFHEFKLGLAVSENTALTEATGVDDLFDRLEASGNVLRLDPDVRPTSYKCATVTAHELEVLRRIRTVVRKGHVSRVSKDKLDLTHGTFALKPGAICIDCTASAIPKPLPSPIFQPGQIYLNLVRTCQPSFSAALIAHIETTRETDDEKNQLCRPVPLPTRTEDWLRMNFVNRQNQYAWLQEPDLRDWLKSCRLDALTNNEKPQSLTPKGEALGLEIKATMFPSTIKLKQLIDQLDAV
jgi:hypothetical protein